MFWKGYAGASEASVPRVDTGVTPDTAERLLGALARLPDGFRPHPKLERTLELNAMPEPQPGDRLWQNFDPDVYRRWSGLELHAFIIRQSPAGAPEDGLVREWRTAGPDVDKHRGYALQWFVMSAAAAAVTLYLMYLARRDSRRAPDHAD